MLPLLHILLMILFSNEILALPKWKVAIALNEDSTSSSTSNSIENHIENGVRLALTEFPKEAASVEVTFINHGESAKKTLEAIQRINEIKPNFAIGMGNSFQALLSAKHLSKEITLISPVATSDEILEKSDNIYLLSNVNSIQAILLIDRFKRELNGNSKVLLVYVEGCPYCKNMADHLAIELKQIGLKFESIHLHSANLRSNAEIQKIVAYDHIFLPVHEEASATLIALFYQKNKNALFWGGDGWGPLARYIRRLPYSAKIRAKWIAHYHNDLKTRSNRNFVSAFRSKFSNDPVDTSAFYYEAMKILLENQNKKSGFEAITARGSFEGVTGTVKLLKNRAIRPMPLLKLDRGEVSLEDIITFKEAK